MKHVSICVVLVFVTTIVGSAQTPGGAAQPGVVRLDGALNAIVSTGAKLELLKGDYFGIAEGPVWVNEGRSGYLLISDIGANAVYKWSPDGSLSVFLDRAGYTGNEPANVGNIAFNGRLNVATFGPNGLALDREGRLVIAAQGDRTIVRVDKDGTRTVLAERYEGKRINGPNDLALKSDGAVYFTDPGSGLRGGATSLLRELPFRGVFRAKDGQVQLLDREPQGLSPNGIAFSPDEKYLYVNGGNKITRYDVQADGTISNGRLFADLTGEKMRGTTDGMKVDPRGTVFTSGPGGVWILSDAGKALGRIQLPETTQITNLAFGDPDGRSLYIVTMRSLYRIRLNQPGLAS